MSYSAWLLHVALLPHFLQCACSVYDDYAMDYGLHYNDTESGYVYSNSQPYSEEETLEAMGPPPDTEDYLYDTCVASSTGELLINGTSDCDLIVVGADVAADQLEGGLDGVYRMQSCYNGKPIYRREGMDEEPRTLWFSPEFGDWEFSSSDITSTDLMIMYGNYGHVSPLDVPAWHLAAALNGEQAELMSDPGDDMYYVVPGITVSCLGVEQPFAHLVHTEL